MSVPRGALVIVEPSLLELVTRYIRSPRKRLAVSIEIAQRSELEPMSLERTAQIATGISARLDTVVRAEELALENPEPYQVNEFAESLFREIAWLAASTGAVFDQGTGRWLGLLAYPERFTTMETPRSLRHLVRAIRHLLQSSGTLVPNLWMNGFHEALPASGGLQRASGFLNGEFMGWTEALLTGEPAWPMQPLAREYFGKEAAEEWRDVTIRAVRAALRRGGHLLEVDASVLRARRTSEFPRRRSDIRALRPQLDSAVA